MTVVHDGMMARMVPQLRADRDRLPELLRTMGAYAAEVLSRIDGTQVAAAPNPIELAPLASDGIAAMSSS